MSYLSRRFTGLSVVRRASDFDDDVRGPLGLNLLHAPSEPLIDFIFVHGLRGGSRKTWSKTESIAHYWPQEWLPAEPGFKNVRIHSFGYNSDWGERKASALTVHDFGQALLGDIHTSPHLTQNGCDTPIVLVGHSMGGIVIKKAFLLARQDPNYRLLAARFHSMFFLATPHRGADSALLLENLLKVSVSHNSKAYVGDIKPSSGAGQVINDEFRNAYQGTQLWSFFETVGTSLGLIVDKESAVLGLPNEHVHLLNADHRHVCKFDDPSDSNYCTIRNAFLSVITSIENTYYSARKDQHRDQMRKLSSYLGVLQRPEADLADVADKQMEGSCTWLTSKESFGEWHKGSDITPKFYWLSGEPATGKSTLAGHVVKYLDNCNDDCSFFFFKHGNATKSTTSQLLRSLAWQMAYVNTAIRQDLLAMQQNGELVDREDERSFWRTVFLNCVFQTALRQPHFWVIDALDECTNCAGLFSLLAKVDKHYPLHVFLTSRPSPALERLFTQEKISSTRVRTTQETSIPDIRLYVEARGNSLPVDEDQARHNLIDKIVTKSNGNFLWASLVLHELEAAHTETQIRDVLHSVPTEMDDFYRRILDKLLSAPRNVELAKAILRWTVCATRPLTTEELKEALRFDIDDVVPRLETTAGSICGHLVYVDTDMRVQVIHQTVRAFLVSEGLDSDFAIVRSKEHSRLARVCLDYLSGSDFRSPRYRRGSVPSRQPRRSVFADYAVSNFAEHVARSTSSEDAHLVSLDSFLRTNVLMWIEVIAASGDLYPLMNTAKHLKTYLERRAKHLSPLGKEVQNISSWTTDLSHIIAEFGKTLLAAPSAIHFLLPAICPPKSMIYKVAQPYPRAFEVVGVSQTEWDDRLSCIVLPNVRVLSISCCDNRFCVGLSDGTVRIYNTTTFQEAAQMNHGEPVRCVKFANVNTHLVTAGRTKIRLWDVVHATAIWTVDVSGQPLSLEFNEDDTILMAATQANTMSFWRVSNGSEVENFQFHDLDEETGAEFHYKRPPIFAALAPGLNLLAVAYRQRPITIWDLADNHFVGQFHKSATSYPWPLIVALLFNPKPEISLVAAAYHGGDIVVFDPFTLRECATVTAEASILAASPNGFVLATGHGSSGIISLYDFETLTMLYHINSYEQDIKAMVFTSNSLRFFDIRGDQCNVWEPAVLLRRSDSADDSSLDFSEEIPSGPQYVTSRSHDDDLIITALIAYGRGEYIFCGRENGSVAAYSAKTGQVVQELFSQGRNVAVLSLAWNDHRNLLAVSDRSTRVVVRCLTKGTSSVFAVDSPSLDTEANVFVHQMLFNQEGSRLLVSTSQADNLWDLGETHQIAQHRSTFDRTSWSWVAHPSYRDRIVFIENSHMRVYTWADLTELSVKGGIELVPAANDSLIVADVSCSPLSRNVCVQYSSPRTSTSRPRLDLWPSASLQPDVAVAKSIASYTDLAADIKCIVGLLRSTLVFLSHTGWICSINAGLGGKERSYTRHFFIPFGWHSAQGDDLLMRVVDTGSIVLALRDELAIFHNGLDFDEKIALEMSAEPPVRSTMKRGRSLPLV